MTQFKIATFNVNSIRTRLALVLSWLEKEQPDVLCLQETKVQDADFPVQPFLDTGYAVAFAGQKSYNGVATVSRRPIEDLRVGFEDGSDGPRLLRGACSGIVVINSYVPQGRSADSEHFQYKLAWLKRFRELLEREYTPQQPIVWVGDLNVAPEDIDVYDPQGLRGHVDFHPDAQAALEAVRAWGLVDVFRLHHPGEVGQYTYYDYRAINAIEKGIGWRIDHVLATTSLARRSTACRIDLGPRRAERPSDHTFLVAEFEI